MISFMSFATDSTNPHNAELLKLIERFEWLYRNSTDTVVSSTIRDSLVLLRATVEEACEAFENDRLPQSQQALEDGLMHVLMALGRMGASPDEALCRAWQRVHQNNKQGSQQEKAFHIFQDRVEVRVGDTTQGSWPLFTLEDYQSFTETARALGCAVVHHDMRQLELFS